jgi:glutathione S-transferase
MNDLILHSYRRCPFAIRVRMVLEEKGLAYEIKEEKLSAKSEELLRLHPEGRVPLLIHIGKALPESAVIAEYLEEVYPEPSLMPEGGAWAKAQMRIWTHWCDRTFKPDVDLYKYRWPQLLEADQEALTKRLESHFFKLESALSGQAFLMGRELSLADIHVFPFYRQIRKSRENLPELFKIARCEAWLQRITERPSFERVMRR